MSVEQWSKIRIERDQGQIKLVEYPCLVKSKESSLTVAGLIVINGGDIQIQIPTRLPTNNPHSVRAMINKELLSDKKLNIQEFYQLFRLEVGTNARLLSCSSVGGYRQDTAEDFYYYQLIFGGLWTHPEDIEKLVLEMESIANIELTPVRVYDL